MKISFIGVGDMGKYMALNLVKKGLTVTVFNRSGKGFEDFEALGASASTDINRAAEADLIFLCLTDDAAVKSTVQALLPLLNAGQTIVDCSTISYQTTLTLARLLEEAGVDFLDAPVSGQRARAEDGTLTIMCGGREAVFEQVRPILSYMGKKLIYMGGSGSGQLTKLINQLLFDINAAALAEILPLSAKMGLDSEKIGEVVNSGTGRSFASEFFIPRDLDGCFTDGYPLRKAYKDMISAAELSANEGVPLPILHAAMTTYQMTVLRGYGDDNKGAMIKLYEELLGVEFRKKNETKDQF